MVEKLVVDALSELDKLGKSEISSCMKPPGLGPLVVEPPKMSVTEFPGSKDVDSIPLPPGFLYEPCYEELKKYAVPLVEQPTPELLSGQIARVQGFRDRVTEMAIEAIRNCRRAKRLYEVMFAKEIVNRVEKTQEQRTAAVHGSYPQFVEAMQQAEDYERICRSVLDNLRATHESISRQISVFQMMLELREIERQGKSGKTSWDKVGR